MKRPLLVLLGPTASGKTSFSIRLAHALQEQGITLEIVNSDSRQLYRHLDIGTAKITREEMQGIPHHLFDVLDPKEEATAPWFQKQAMQVIADILARNHVPMLVGGSMLYIRAITDNLQFVSRPDTALREKLSLAYDQDQGRALLQQLIALDPEAEHTIDPKNKRYLIRALEVCLTSSLPLMKAKKTIPSPFDLLILGLQIPREKLCERIAERVDAQVRGGWVEEVSDLLEKGYTVDDPGMVSTGYREIANALRTRSIEEIRQSRELWDAIKAQTRQYAKRQMTWWKRDTRIRWISPN